MVPILLSPMLAMEWSPMKLNGCKQGVVEIKLDCVILELGKKPNAQPLQGQSNLANCHYI